MNGSMSEMSTDLPRIRAAIPIETVENGASPVPLTINKRTNATTYRATKKKIVGGSTAKNSSLSFEVTLLIGSPQWWLYRGPRDGVVCGGLLAERPRWRSTKKRAGSRGQQFLHEAMTRDKGIEPPRRPLWVKNRHLHCTSPCPLCPRKRTFNAACPSQKISAIFMPLALGERHDGIQYRALPPQAWPSRAIYCEAPRHKKSRTQGLPRRIAGQNRRKHVLPHRRMGELSEDSRRAAPHDQYSRHGPRASRGPGRRTRTYRSGFWRGNPQTSGHQASGEKRTRQENYQTQKAPLDNILRVRRDVRFTPESGHLRCN